MSNPLSVRRVRLQDIDAEDRPLGAPYYGIVASDNYATVLNAGCPTHADLEATIANSSSILAAATCDMDEQFEGADHAKIGRDNFDGKDWQLDDMAMYRVAVYYADDEEPGLRRPVGVWEGPAPSRADARRLALDELSDDRLSGWSTEIVGYKDEEDDDDDKEDEEPSDA